MTVTGALAAGWVGAVDDDDVVVVVGVVDGVVDAAGAELVTVLDVLLVLGVVALGALATATAVGVAAVSPESPAPQPVSAIAAATDSNSNAHRVHADRLAHRVDVTPNSPS